MAVKLLPDGLFVCETHGSGPVLLWLHGYSMNSALWAPIWGAMPGCRHLGLDLPGHGFSRRFEPGDTLASIGAVVATLVRGERVAGIVGLSFGSMLALEAAIQLGTELSFLVLSAPTIAGTEPEREVQSRNRDMREGWSQGLSNKALSDLWMTSPPDIFRRCETDPALWASIAREVHGHSWEELGSDVMRSIYEEEQADARLARISAKTLVLAGTEDMRLHKRIMYRLSAVLPACRHEWVAGAGHIPLLEEPLHCAMRILEHLQLPHSRPG